MRKRVMTAFFALMTLCSMSFIFLNSAMNSEDSGDLSLGVVRFLYGLVQNPPFRKNASETVQSPNSGTESEAATESFAAVGNAETENGKSDPQKDQRIQKLNKPIRKAAHAVEYVFLGFSLCGLYLCLFSKSDFRKCGLWTLLSGVLYAASDEFHQLFVDGRACQASDVVIDTVGVSVGILLLLSMAFLLKRGNRAS